MINKKIISLTILFLIISGLFCTLFYRQNKHYPLSAKNQFYFQLEQALHTAGLKTANFTYLDFQNQLKFYLLPSQTQVILSTQKDPYWQISLLQQIIKKAKIMDKTPQLIDLSGHHPYATIKNS